jgi:hypothetical protein
MLKMAIFTFSPGVMLALILALLLILVVVAFNRHAAENILRFFTGLLDLYQRWRQLRIHPVQEMPEQNAGSSTEHDYRPGSEPAPVTDEAPHVLTAIQQRRVGQQHLSRPESMGE